MSDIEDSMNCPVCMDTFQEPKVLRCGHSLCEDCVNRLWNGVSVRCPLCRKGTMVEIGSSLTTNHALKRLVSAIGASDLEGLSCSTDGCHWSALGSILEGLWYCSQCQVLVCSTCVVKHHRDHEALETYEAFREGGLEALSTAMADLESSIASFEDLRDKMLPKIQMIERKAITDHLPINGSKTSHVCEEAKSLLDKIESALSPLNNVIGEETDDPMISMEGEGGLFRGRTRSSCSHGSGTCSATVAVTPDIVKESMSRAEALKKELPLKIPVLAKLSNELDEVARVIRIAEEQKQMEVAQSVLSTDPQSQAASSELSSSTASNSSASDDNTCQNQAASGEASNQSLSSYALRARDCPPLDKKPPEKPTKDVQTQEPMDVENRENDDCWSAVPKRNEAAYYFFRDASGSESADSDSFGTPFNPCFRSSRRNDGTGSTPRPGGRGTKRGHKR